MLLVATVTRRVQVPSGASEAVAESFLFDASVSVEDMIAIAGVKNPAELSLSRLIEDRSSSEDRQGKGTPEDPFTSSFNAVVFKRHDSRMTLSVCERDEGFEVRVGQMGLPQDRYLSIDPNGVITDLGTGRIFIR